MAFITDDYIDGYIEKCPALGWQGGPGFKTLVVTLANGREKRRACWANVQHSFNLPFRNIKPAAYANIKQMHLLAMGRWGNFKFKDHLDYEAANAQFAIGDGVETVFQLGKLSALDGVFYERECYVIRSAAITVNGSPVSPTVDANRGLVTFVSPPANGAILRWTGEFALWVRFNQDDLPFSIDNKSGGQNIINGSVSLLEMPPPPLP